MKETIQSLRRTHWIALAVLSVASVLFYRGTWSEMIGTWWTDTTFSHGLLILPISAYLVYHGRRELVRTELQWSWAGVALIAVLSGIWFFGHFVQVRLIEQMAIVMILQASLLATLGPQFIRRFLFPVAFLWFAVPFGKGLVPPLMEATADLSVLFLRLSGIPVYRDAMTLYIPEGTYEVARACSGIKFLTAMVALSSFYAYLMYRGWRKRLAFVLIGVVLAILMNGFRAYLLILIGHVTDMRFDHDGWHVRLGQILFVIVLFAFFKLGARYRDDLEEEKGAVPATERAGASGSMLQGAMTILIGLIAMGLPAVTGSTMVAIGPTADRLAQAVPPLRPAPGWQSGPLSSMAWRPTFVGGSDPMEAVIQNADGQVDVTMRAYPIPADEQNEMVTFHNRIQPDSDERLYPERLRRLTIEGYGDIQVRETTVKGRRDRLVWYWYDIDGRLAATPQKAKISEVRAFLSHGPGVQKVIVVSTTPIDDGSERLLQEFLRDHASQVLPGNAGS